ERYAQENLVISVSGQVDINSVFSKIENNFKELSRDFKQREYNKKYNYNNSKKEYHREINQVHLYFNTIGASYYDKERYTLSVLGNILGGNMSSRLFQEIREKEGLAYSIYSRSSSYEEGGLFMVYAATTKDDYEKVIKIIKRELEKIRKSSVLDREIIRARNQIKSALILSLESTRSRMKRLASSFLFHKKLKSIEDIIKKVEMVTKKDIDKLTNKIFKEENYSITLLGNIKNIEEE
ncbi:MAG: M16 family metallopeptidase, partial [Fusobacteriota bacterium]